MPLSTQEKSALNAEVKAIIRRSSLWSPTDPPETVAALMVVTLARHLGVPHEDIPRVLLSALCGPEGSSQS